MEVSLGRKCLPRGRVSQTEEPLTRRLLSHESVSHTKAVSHAKASLPRNTLFTPEYSLLPFELFYT
jgi:hypothetical protein